MRRLIVVVGLLVSGFGATASPAFATDAYPCGPRFYNSAVKMKVQYCPDWSPNNWIPVYQSARVSAAIVGQIYAPGDDWYGCQGRVPGSVYALGSYQTDVWAVTMADNGRWGYVPEVYFRGGANFEPDATLAPICELG